MSHLFLLINEVIRERSHLTFITPMQYSNGENIKFVMNFPIHVEPLQWLKENYPDLMEVVRNNSITISTTTESLTIPSQYSHRTRELRPIEDRARERFVARYDADYEAITLLAAQQFGNTPTVP